MTEPDLSIQGVVKEMDNVRRSFRRQNLGLAIAVATLVGAIVYVMVAYEVEGPCEHNPAGAECQEVQIAADKARSLEAVCVIPRRAGLGCPALREKLRLEGREDEEDARPGEVAAGDRNVDRPSARERAPNPEVPSAADRSGGTAPADHAHPQGAAPLLGR